MPTRMAQADSVIGPTTSTPEAPFGFLARTPTKTGSKRSPPHTSSQPPSSATVMICCSLSRLRTTPARSTALVELRQSAGVTPHGSITVVVVAPDSGIEQLTEPDPSYDTSVVFS